MGMPDNDIEQTNLRRARGFLEAARNGNSSVETHDLTSKASVPSRTLETNYAVPRN